jgi:hypothetical protein
MNLPALAYEVTEHVPSGKAPVGQYVPGELGSRLIPSTTGLQLAALARTASVQQIAGMARRAAAAAVAIQTLSPLAVRGTGRAGIVLGFRPGESRKDCGGCGGVSMIR